MPQVCSCGGDRIYRSEYNPGLRRTGGGVELAEEIDPELLPHIKVKFEALGFSILDDKRSRIIEQIKTGIVQFLYNEKELNRNLSGSISEAVGYDYHYLSALFSEIENTTIEKFFIARKIEHVKELLVYDELSIKEIAYRMNYSSAAHLSNQFKKITGLSPGHYKRIGLTKRKHLDEV